MLSSSLWGTLAHPVSLSPFACPEFDAALAGTRVVLLGEQSHGDGAAFSAKVELVRHLHLNLGFDVLAFESCFYSLTNIWEEHSGRGQVSSRLARQVYAHWRNAKELVPLWELFDERAQSERPLVAAGIDPRHSGPRAKEHLIEDLERFLSEHVPAALVSEEFERFRDLLRDLLEHEYRHKTNALERAHFMDTLWRLRRQLSRCASELKVLWDQELANLSFFARNAWSFESRDEGMASNLLWLRRVRYPDKKIIVWTHDWHAAKSSSTIKDADEDYRDALAKHPDTPLGEAAANTLGDELYSLTLIAGGGTELPNAYSGDYETCRPLPPPPRDSVEAKLKNTHAGAAFINLRDLPARSFSMSGLEPAKWLSLCWDRVFDGVLFLQEMRPLEHTRQKFRDGRL